MSEETKDGGSAFPIETTATPYASGMSLRDWFAGQALTNPYTAHDGDADKVAEWAYQVADAMIFAKSNRNRVEMKTYRVWGEYGPAACMTIKYTIQAVSREEARSKAVRLLKNTNHWDRIGEHNVYVEERDD